jgi:hypothetical protein
MLAGFGFSKIKFSPAANDNLAVLNKFLKNVRSDNVCGTPSTRATRLSEMFLQAGCVCTNNSKHSEDLNAVFKSITIRISLVDSSRRPLMPSSFLSRTKSAIES